MATKPKLDLFTEHYLIAALWSSTDENEEPIDTNYSLSDCSDEMLNQAIKDCKDFQEQNAEDLKDYPIANAGHDFWLTRNHHGAGFWECDFCEEDEGKRLTESAQKFRELDLYVGDDYKLYFQ